MGNCDCRSHNGFMTAKGLEEAAQRQMLSRSELLAVGLTPRYVDIPGSVSGLRRDEIIVGYDEMSESDLREVLNGT